jgi:hypothetical protein
MLIIPGDSPKVGSVKSHNCHTCFVHFFIMPSTLWRNGRGEWQYSAARRVPQIWAEKAGSWSDTPDLHWFGFMNQTMASLHTRGEKELHTKALSPCILEEFWLFMFQEQFLRVVEIRFHSSILNCLSPCNWEETHSQPGAGWWIIWSNEGSGECSAENLLKPLCHKPVLLLWGGDC